jgi:microcystin-dependent protein
MPDTLITPTTLPAGMVMPYAGPTTGNVPTPPGGWLKCDGTSYATATYPALFNAIGYTYGGAGANFNVPDMGSQARFIYSDGTGGGAVGNRGGTSVALLFHSHDLSNHTHSHSHVPTTGQFITTGTPNTSITATATNYHLTSNTSTDATGPSPNSTGNTGGADSLPPFITMQYFIKT